MNIFIAIIDGIVQPEAFTSLSSCAANYGISYNSAAKGKRKWLIEDKLMVISECHVNKIKGRGTFGINSN